MSRPEDPRIARSRALILDAALEAFLEFGYDGVSVELVAERAGVAKRTVYNIYGEKEALFRATLGRSIATAEQFAQLLTEAIEGLEDVERELPRLAERLAEDVLLGPVLPLRRLLVGEAARFPDLVAQYRRRAPETVLRALSAAFARLADRGLLVIGSPTLAAEHFAFLVMGAEMDRRMLGAKTAQPAKVRAHAREGARVFLAAYGRR
ncbi:TetR/AcrR family transcriptional regulator [Microbacterium jejuense]|uniref:TetR/AcrR family transcriptional regulator n=1 Tax=Microbacterium jejuense TaxID=1263637 RepID=A0ABS7HKZ5_9MICO|nr:TetR/AcrR family transcriptional regulator [Microbacterium jejuense]MBW9092951.1 TetR/AcrR family transcriptional regulator [Microbacterium jejuense]